MLDIITKRMNCPRVPKSLTIPTKEIHCFQRCCSVATVDLSWLLYASVRTKSRNFFRGVPSNDLLYITKLVFEMVNDKFFSIVDGNALTLVILLLKKKKKKKPTTLVILIMLYLPLWMINIS